MTATFRRLACLGLLPLLALTSCQRPAPPAKPDDSRAYAAKGVIEKISPDRHIVTIHHQTIPGYMMEMTMDFPVHDEHLFDGLAPGDQVDFTLHVEKEDAWIEGVHRTGHTDLPAGNSTAMDDGMAPKLKTGDALPDADLLAEDGKHVHLSDFRGKAVVFTFFFTRCPLPTYCPLMNRNFAATRKLLLADPKAPKNWEFISISFDPEFDKPETLASYGDFYRDHNSDRWLFASATPQVLAGFAAPLGLSVSRQDNNFTHNLRTVVVDPQGRLYRQFNDNLWTADQLAQAVIEAANISPGK